MDKRTGTPKIWIYRHPDGTPKVKNLLINCQFKDTVGVIVLYFSQSCEKSMK